MARHPLTAVPATRSSLPLLQIRRRLVVGFLGASVVTGLLSGLAWVASAHAPAAAPAAGPDPTAIALAQTAVTDYLTARKSTVPAVKDVSADFSAPVVLGQPSVKPLDASNLTYQGSQEAALGDSTRTQIATVQESFTVTIGGALYTVTVPMVNAGGAGCTRSAAVPALPTRCWLLGATPALAPATLAADQSAPGIDYGQLYGQLGGTDALLPSPAYKDQIKAWATTFAAAGHADTALLRLTGDPGSHTYSGLGGWSVVGDPQVKSVVAVSKPDAGFIVRVGLVLRPAAANGPTLSTDYDLYLLSDKSQSLPPVVAWGAAGSYHTLTPYMNADQP